MKTISTVVVVLLLAGTANAGLDFADSYSTPATGSVNASITINPTGGVYDPVGSVDFAATNTPATAVIDAIWNNPVNANSPAGSPDLILWFGSISVQNGSLFLTAVGVSEDGSTFTTQSFSSALTTSGPMAYYVNLNDALITPTQRDQIVAARLTFSYGTGVTFNLDGVSTPEPTTLALFGLGLLGLGGAAVRRRRRRAKAV